jgi:hypothetical protein
MTAFAASSAPPITSTGVRGFLKWYQREQPEVYQVIAPKLPVVAPAVFGAYISSRVRATRRLGSLADARARRRTHLMVSGLGQDDDDDTGYILNPDLTINTSTLTDSGSANPVDITSLVQSTTLPDISDTASSSAGTTTTNTSAIGSLIAGVTGLFVSQQQAQTAQQITALQLQRAQAGLSPLNISMGANGVPTITGIASNPGALLLLLGAGLLLVMLMGGKKAA